MLQKVRKTESHNNNVEEKHRKIMTGMTDHVAVRQRSLESDKKLCRST